MPESPYTFSSPAGLFRRADTQGFPGPLADEVPTLIDRGIYCVQGRMVRLEVQPPRNGKRPSAILVRLDWQYLPRTQRWRATLLSLFRLDLARVTAASGKDAKAVFTAVRWTQREAGRYVDGQKALLDQIQQEDRVNHSTAPLCKTLAVSIATQFHRFGLHNAIEALMSVHRAVQSGKDIARARELAETILTELREKLDGKLDACDVKGVKLSRAAILKEISHDCIQLALDPLRGDSQYHPAVRHVADDVRRHLIAPFQPFPYLIEHGLSTVPMPQPELPAMDQVAVACRGDNAVPFLHTLVRLGYFEVNDAAGWRRLCGMVAESTPLVGKKFNAFHHALRNTLKPILNARRRTLTLLRGIPGDPMVAMCILNFLFDKGPTYEIMFSKHEKKLFHYIFQSISRGARNAVGPNTRPPDDPALSQVHAFLTHPDAVPDSRFVLAHLFRKAYAYRTKLVSCSDDGSTLFSHAFVHRKLLHRLCAEAGVDPADDRFRMLNGINFWFQFEVMEAASFARFTRPGTAVDEVGQDRGWDRLTTEPPQPPSSIPGITAPDARIPHMLHQHGTSPDKPGVPGADMTPTADMEVRRLAQQLAPLHGGLLDDNDLLDYLAQRLAAWRSIDWNSESRGRDGQFFEPVFFCSPNAGPAPAASQGDR